MPTNNELDLEELVRAAKEAVKISETEEDLKLRIAPLFDKIARNFGLKPADYEHKIRAVMKGDRPDAMYGHLIIEYKSPGILSQKTSASSAIEQVKNYIIQKSETEQLKKSLYFASIFDGYMIAFVRYSEVEDTWKINRPIPIGRESLLKIVEAISGLRRKPLDAEILIKDLGPRSEIAIDFINELFRTKIVRPRTKILYEEWYSTFLQVVAYDPKKLKELDEIYRVGLRTEEEGKRLLFAIQTYYAMVMKLLSAEIISFYSGGRFMKSYLAELEDASLRGKLREAFFELENEGGIFQKLMGISNFLEGDYFSWYIEEWNKNIETVIAKLIHALSFYEPSTTDLEPERIRDLFKVLYQELLPRKLRHSFGEYYTPDWLSELVLDEVGYVSNQHPINKRLLDPACGSGTFLVTAIKRLQLYREEHNIDPRVIFESAIKDIVGYDLNPLAVLSSRANFIIALADLLRYRPKNFEIPVYLCDSISIRPSNVIDEQIQVYELRTVVGSFRIPVPAVERNEIHSVLDVLKSQLTILSNEKEFEEVLKLSLPRIEYADVIIQLYKKLMALEREKKNRIWVGLLRNSFAPLLQGRFDYVVGNPPWINWESLPERYREISKNLWEEMGLITKGKTASLGRVKRDLAMLFIAVSTKRYLKEGGRLGMLLPFTLFKVTAGQGFRETVAGYHISKIHDLVEVKPFEGATTRTSLLTLIKDGRTPFPIPTKMWRPRTSVKQNWALQRVVDSCDIFELSCFPSEINKIGSPWLMLSGNAYNGLRKAIGVSPYDAHAGVYTGLNGAYWVEVLHERGNELFIRNLNEVGKIKVPKVEGWVESELVVQLVRGRDTTNWIGRPSTYMLLPHYSDGKPIPESIMKRDFPKGYLFLNTLRARLLKRSIYKLWGKSAPFYAVFDIGNYTFSPFKVAWQYISGNISGKADFVPSLLVSKSSVIVPNEKLMFIPCKKEDEAFFVLGFLNSSISKLIVASYAIETHIAPDIMKRVGLPMFNAGNELHVSVSRIARQIFELVNRSANSEVAEHQENLDRTVASLLGITDEELVMIQHDLALLMNKAPDGENEILETDG